MAGQVIAIVVNLLALAVGVLAALLLIAAAYVMVGDFFRRKDKR